MASTYGLDQTIRREKREYSNPSKYRTAVNGKPKLILRYCTNWRVNNLTNDQGGRNVKSYRNIWVRTSNDVVGIRPDIGEDRQQTRLRDNCRCWLVQQFAVFLFTSVIPTLSKCRLNPHPFTRNHSSFMKLLVFSKMNLLPRWNFPCKDTIPTVVNPPHARKRGLISIPLFFQFAISWFDFSLLTVVS